MTQDSARSRWLAITAVRVAAPIGALLGVLLIGRATDWPTRILGIAIIVMAFVVLATVPRGLARRWRSGER